MLMESFDMLVLATLEVFMVLMCCDRAHFPLQ